MKVALNGVATKLATAEGGPDGDTNKIEWQIYKHQRIIGGSVKAQCAKHVLVAANCQLSSMLIATCIMSTKSNCKG